MKTNHFPSVVIGITAAIWAGFAIWLGVNPGVLLPAFGVNAMTPEMLTEVRAFYGGMEMAIAVAMVALWWRGDLFASLVIGGLPLLGAASGRIVGLFIDGYSTLHVGFALLELIGAVFCWVGCIMISKKPVP